MGGRSTALSYKIGVGWIVTGRIFSYFACLQDTNCKKMLHKYSKDSSINRLVLSTIQIENMFEWKQLSFLGLQKFEGLTGGHSSFI